MAAGELFRALSFIFFFFAVLAGIGETLSGDFCGTFAISFYFYFFFLHSSNGSRRRLRSPRADTPLHVTVNI